MEEVRNLKRAPKSWLGGAFFYNSLGVLPGFFHHSNFYLHQNLHHHPANTQSVLASLIHKIKALCNLDSSTQKL